MSKKSIADIAAKAIPAVVSIIITKHLSAITEEVPPEMAHLLRKESSNKKSLENMADAKGMVEVGGGSGFIIDREGIIITNRHVVEEKEADYTIIFNDDSKAEAEIIARDPVNDIAVLKIKKGLNDYNSGLKKGGVKLPILTLGDAAKIRLGDPIITIGNSLGLFRNTVSAGIVSGLSRSIKAQIDKDSPTQEMRGLIQTDASINPGNSGGPLLNDKGEVIGVNTAIIFGAQNIGFAIPINGIKRDLNDLKKYGEIRRPLLGLRYLTINSDLAIKLKLPSENGALIIKEDEHTPGVIPNSPAAKAGLKEEDLIIKCDGKEINQNYTIQDLLEEKQVGETISLTINRQGKIKEVKVALAGRN